MSPAGTVARKTWNLFILSMCTHARRPYVVSGVVPVGNLLYMLFQEGRSSNLCLRRGVEQVVPTRNKPSGKCTGVYYMWIVWVTRRRGLRIQNSNPVRWLVRLQWTTSRARMRAVVRRKYTRNEGRLTSRVLLVWTLVPRVIVLRDNRSRDALYHGPSSSYNSQYTGNMLKQSKICMFILNSK